MIVEDQSIMIVEDQRSEDKFPSGLRVLAVDDDPICLKVLENLLRKCQYQITTTNQAITALKLLRENKNKYDLVISDVNMPDMDGFKLLELVGLEMDLPVIMLSAHSDKELVYKGVTHGAVDYLLKPVRLEELKNIWQHVIRKKKLSPKDQNRSSDQDKPREETAEGGQGGGSTGSVDQNGKLNQQRKDQDSEDEEDGEENGHENEEPGTQKKPRVVWSVELHRKFVAAVDQLGLDKAVPKKILDLMNVEGLTRENVASHLQKYRLYLKRISSVASQQANMVAAFGAKDSSYLRMGSLDGFGDFLTITGPGRISSTSLSSYPPSNVLGRLNSPAGLTLYGIASSGMLNPVHSQTLNSSVNNHGSMQPSLLPSNQAANLFQGTASALESNHFHGRSSTNVGEFNRSDDTTDFLLETCFQDSRVNISNMGSGIPTAPSNPLMLQTNVQQSQSRGAFTNQSSLSMPSLNYDSFDVGGRNSSNFLDHNRCSDNWQGVTQLSKFPSNSLSLSESFSHDTLPANNMRDSMPTSSHINNSSIGFSSSSGLAEPLETSRPDMQGQAGLTSSIIPNTNYTSNQRWEHGQNYSSSLKSSFSIINSLVSGNGAMGSLGQNMDQRKRFNEPLLGQLNSGAPSFFQHTEVDNHKIRSNEDFLLEQGKPQNGFIQNNFESLDEIMNAMIKREQNETVSMEGEFGFDAYPLGSCM